MEFDNSFEVPLPPAQAWKLLLDVERIAPCMPGAELTEVVNTDYQPIPGLYAAGELVGGLFYFNYPGATGLMSGAVFGRIAGRSAARAAIERGPAANVA